MISLLYTRGDVREADVSYALNVPENVCEEDYALDYGKWSRRHNAEPAKEFTRLGAFAKIGLCTETSSGVKGEFSQKEILENRDDNPNRLLAMVAPIKDGEIVSSTGQIRFQPKRKQFAVVTPKSEALVQEGKRNRGTMLTVANNSTFSSIFAGSLDDLPLNESRRVLLLHLTDVKASNCEYRFYGEELRQFSWGKYPFLLRRGTADVTIKNSGIGVANLYALDMSGRRIQEVPYAEKNGAITFRADNSITDECPMAYELIRN